MPVALTFNPTNFLRPPFNSNSFSANISSCQVSHVRCHLSRVMFQVSHVTSHVSQLLFFVVELVGGGSIINGASPPSFLDSSVQFAICKKLLMLENVCFVYRKSETPIKDCLIVVMKILVTMVGSMERQTKTKIKKPKGCSQ